MVVNDLYATDRLSTSFAFSDEVILSALRRIWRGDLDLLSDVEENLFRETKRHIDAAIDRGFAYTADEDFRELLKFGSSSFSAFKVHRLQNDIAAQLLDDKGDLKSFERFSTDVQPLTDHQCKKWLRTEYDTAVLRSHRAAQWRQFLRESQYFPNIRWLPSTSMNPREEHRIFWDLVLPITHPFWQKHQPGDDWNCQCDWESTDDEPTPLPAGWLSLNPAKGLEGNVGSTGKLFTDQHPYVTRSVLSPEKLKEIVEKFLRRELQKSAKANIAKLKELIDPFDGLAINNPDAVNGRILILRKSFKNILEHGGDTNEMLHYISQFKFKNLNDWKYIGWAKHNRPHPESNYVTYYEFTFMEKRYYAIMRSHKVYDCEVLHTIRSTPPSDLIEGFPK